MTTLPEAPWLLHARSEQGVRTFAPGRSNPRITAYHAGTNIAGYDDKAAWCSSFVQWCLARCGIAGTGSALARSWLEWGRALDEPRHGCIAVLTRDDPKGWRGHVGFHLRSEGDDVVLLGGNQRDSVCEHRYPARSILGWRWPDTGDDDVLFTTPRTRVRRLRRGDAPALHAIYGDAAAMRFVGDGKPLTLQRCEEWIEVTFGNLERRGYGMCAVVSRADPALMIGSCGLVHPGGQAEAEVKYAFRPDHWGQGYAREVIPALVRYGIEVQQLGRVIATVNPAHTVSRRVLAHAGLSRRADRRNDDGSTSGVYAIGAAGVRIRPARDDEAAALTAIALAAKGHWGYSAADLERWRPELAIDEAMIARGTTWVAEVDGERAGVLMCTETAPEWTLDNLWVAPARTGSGIGRALLEHALCRARDAGARTMALDADPHAEGFYRRMGAERFAVVAAPLEGQPDRVRPQMRLAVP